MSKLLTLVNQYGSESKDILSSLNENFITIKKKLGNEIDIAAQNIQFFDDQRNILDNNDFIRPELNTIFYEIINAPTDEVTLEIQKNHFGIPKWIQVNSSSTVKELKNELSKFARSSLKTYVFHENGEMLENDQKIKSYGLQNGSKITVWRGVNLLVPLTFYHATNICQNVLAKLQFSMTDKVSDVKNKIAEIISPGIASNLALITDTSYWQHDKRLIDYPVRQEGTDVYVEVLNKKPNITDKKEIKKGIYANVFTADAGFGQKIILNRYKTDKRPINEKKILKYEIISHIFFNKNKQKNKNLFVELRSMYEEDKYFYIGTEYMEQGSLKTLYSKAPLTEGDIVDFSIQICEALNFMHSNKFIHRNLKCSSVLITDERKIKLTNFHLSKYLFNVTTEQLLDGIPGSRIETSKCWMAPEVLRNDPYGIKADIWSLGVTILEMLTRDRPYPELNVLLATHRIVSENTIHYDRYRVSPNLQQVIDRCLHSSQWERPTALQCKQVLEEIRNR